MPGATVKSALGNVLANSFNQQRTQKVALDTGSFGGFSAGIDNGVAEITRMVIDKHKEGDNAGKQYFMIYGTCKTPAQFAGEQGSLLLEPLYDTPDRKSRKTVDEHVRYVISVLQDFGVDTGTLNWPALESGELFKVLVKKRLHARFRTWKGEPTPQYPNPRTNVNYMGKCNAPSPAANNGAVVDRTATVADNAAVEDGGYGEQANAEASYEEPNGADAGAEYEEHDFAALGAAADGGDTDAQGTLQRLADENGIDWNNAATWAEVGAQLSALGTDVPADGGDGGAAEPDAAAPAWEKGNVGYYKPPRARKAVEIEVTAVFSNGKVNIRNIATKEIYKGVDQSALMDQA